MLETLRNTFFFFPQWFSECSIKGCLNIDLWIIWKYLQNTAQNDTQLTKNNNLNLTSAIIATDAKEWELSKQHNSGTFLCHRVGQALRFHSLTKELIMRFLPRLCCELEVWHSLTAAQQHLQWRIHACLLPSPSEGHSSVPLKRVLLEHTEWQKPSCPRNIKFPVCHYCELQKSLPPPLFFFFIWLRLSPKSMWLPCMSPCCQRAEWVCSHPE